jgi:hypothetical protein
MGQYGAFRFGRDLPARILTSTNVLTEASELLPDEPMYQPLIPFYPSLVEGTASSASTASDDWKQFPGRLDLFCYQGDDVQIPLYFQDPSDWDIDMSTVAGWEWKAEVRVIHNARSTLVHEFVVAAEYIPPEPTDEQPQGVTQVTLFLPHQLNYYTGQYHWDVQSVGPFDGPVYPTEPPLGIEVDEWPPTTSIKTWLYGQFWVVPRVTATEWVPPPDALPVGGGGAVPVVVTSAGFCVGPNGRVP